MATARYIMGFTVSGTLASGRVVRLSRPCKEPWQLALPGELDKGRTTLALVEYVTAEYLMALPTEAVRLGWETIYALVRMALVESEEDGWDGSGCEVV